MVADLVQWSRFGTIGQVWGNIAHSGAMSGGLSRAQGDYRGQYREGVIYTPGSLRSPGHAGVARKGLAESAISGERRGVKDSRVARGDAAGVWPPWPRPPTGAEGLRGSADPGTEPSEKQSARTPSASSVTRATGRLPGIAPPGIPEGRAPPGSRVGSVWTRRASEGRRRTQARQ